MAAMAEEAAVTACASSRQAARVNPVAAMAADVRNLRREYMVVSGWAGPWFIDDAGVRCVNESFYGGPTEVM
ncbi:MAG: hypothetical protein ABWX88_00665, partial [Pseudoxanthomonas sp.]